MLTSSRPPPPRPPSATARSQGGRRATPWTAPGVVMWMVLVVLLSACVIDDPPAGSAAEADAVQVAATADAEGQVLAAVLVELLETAELPAELVGFADARDARQALELGAVDVAVGYTGEAWLETLGRADPPGDPQASFGPVRVDDARRRITWLGPRFADEPLREPPANATFAFVVRGPPGVDADLSTVSQLAARLGEQPEATVCVDREFGSREDGLRAVLDAYRVRSDRPFLATDPAEAVTAVASGTCIAGLTTATDGAAWSAGLRPLIDDLGVFPAFVIAAQVRDPVLEERPEVRGALAPFAELTTALVGAWNAQVVSGASPEDVAVEAREQLVARVEARAAARAEEDGDGTDGTS